MANLCCLSKGGWVWDRRVRCSHVPKHATIYQNLGHIFVRSRLETDVSFNGRETCLDRDVIIGLGDKLAGKRGFFATLPPPNMGPERPSCDLTVNSTTRRHIGAWNGHSELEKECTRMTDREDRGKCAFGRLALAGRHNAASRVALAISNQQSQEIRVFDEMPLRASYALEGPPALTVLTGILRAPETSRPVTLGAKGNDPCPQPLIPPTETLGLEQPACFPPRSASHVV